MTPAERQQCLEKLSSFPAQLRALVSDLSPEQLTTVYLPGEWTVAQNVHHVADAHLNGYIRMKLILTEDQPPLKAYDQDKWAVLPDATPAALEVSFKILEGLHERWCQTLAQVSETDWQRTGIHSASGEVSLEKLLQTYAAHCDAHLDQITRTLAA